MKDSLLEVLKNQTRPVPIGGHFWPGGWRIGDPSHLDLGGAGHAMMISLGK